MTTEHAHDDEAHRVSGYADRLTGDYGFEEVLVEARQRRVMELLRRVAHRSVLEIGCGPQLLVTRWAETHDVPRWTIVEPSAQFSAAARGATAGLAGVEILETLLEDIPAGGAPEPSDIVLVSSLLHEVRDPADFLARVRPLVAASGTLHVNVPNALSLHRRLARAMGLICDETELSARNRYLEQRRVFTPDELHDLLRTAGFEPYESGGYFLKPFTHAQMEALPFVSQELLNGLDVLGVELPELASEIYANCLVRG